MTRSCRAFNEHAEPCGTPPLLDSDLCFWHDPRYEHQRADARKAGGSNHAKEQALKAVFDLPGVTTIEDSQRIAEIATTSLLALDNTVGRNRALLSAAGMVARLIETGKLAAEIEAIRSVLEPRLERLERKPWWRR